MWSTPHHSPGHQISSQPASPATSTSAPAQVQTPRDAPQISPTAPINPWQLCNVCKSNVCQQANTCTRCIAIFNQAKRVPKRKRGEPVPQANPKVKKNTNNAAFQTTLVATLQTNDTSAEQYFSPTTTNKVAIQKLSVATPQMNGTVIPAQQHFPPKPTPNRAASRKLPVATPQTDGTQGVNLKPQNAETATPAKRWVCRTCDNNIVESRGEQCNHCQQRICSVCCVGPAKENSVFCTGCANTCTSCGLFEAPTPDLLCYHCLPSFCVRCKTASVALEGMWCRSCQADGCTMVIVRGKQPQFRCTNSKARGLHICEVHFWRAQAKAVEKQDPRLLGAVPAAASRPQGALPGPGPSRQGGPPTPGPSH